MPDETELFLPIKVYIYMTNYCHYSCDYCFFKEMGMLNSEQLSEKQLEKIIYYLKKYEVPLVAICGGDPVLHHSLPYFAKAVSENGNYPILATNAVDVSYDELMELKLSGIKYLQIGIDSLSSSKDENYKEEKHLRKVKKSIGYLKKLGLLFGFATCVTKRNLDELKEIADYAKKSGAELLKLSVYSGDNPRYQLTDVQRVKLKEFVKEYNVEEIFVRYSPVVETLNFISKYPDLTIYANGDLVIEQTGEVIGNIDNSEPAIEYRKYLNRRNNNEI